MNKITYDQIVSFGPCYDPVKYISTDWQGTALEMLRMTDVPAKDRLWVVVRHQYLTDKQIHLYGLACARMAERYTTDERVEACNDTVQAYLQGEATAEQLFAARAAAVSAAESAAWSAARAAAWSAAWSAVSAAESAAESAARAAARAAAESAAESAAAAATTTTAAAEEKQVQALIKILEAEGE